MIIAEKKVKLPMINPIFGYIKSPPYFFQKKAGELAAKYQMRKKANALANMIIINVFSP
ncbi:hypothetical protein GCM10020331_072350 [Ectobacillus funiculus]